MKIRSRMCGAPKAAAGRQSHRASYPHVANSPRTRPSPRERRAETFSNTTKRGRRSRTMRVMRQKRPDRSASSPPPAPAWLMSWHGKPAQRTSIGARTWEETRKTSENLSASGQCRSSTRRQKGSISTCHSVRASRPQARMPRSSPSSRPPIPEHREPMRIGAGTVTTLSACRGGDRRASETSSRGCSGGRSRSRK